MLAPAEVVWPADLTAPGDRGAVDWHRVGVGFSEGQVLLPFYARSREKATFTVLH